MSVLNTFCLLSSTLFSSPSALWPGGRPVWLPSPLVSTWVQPMVSTYRRSKGGNKVRSEIFFPKISSW